MALPVPWAHFMTLWSQEPDPHPARTHVSLGINTGGPGLPTLTEAVPRCHILVPPTHPLWVFALSTNGTHPQHAPKPSESNRLTSSLKLAAGHPVLTATPMPAPSIPFDLGPFSRMDFVPCRERQGPKRCEKGHKEAGILIPGYF